MIIKGGGGIFSGFLRGELTKKNGLQKSQNKDRCWLVFYTIHRPHLTRGGPRLVDFFYSDKKFFLKKLKTHLDFSVNHGLRMQQ